MFGMSEEDVKAMTEDLNKIHKKEIEQHSKDQELLERIKEQISKDEFDTIQEEIDLSENTSNFGTVNEPTGDPQEEDGVKIWVDQNSVGDYRDTFTGTVCMELPDGKFIMWDYWM